MPKTVHCPTNGYWKEIVAAMQPGQQQRVDCRNAGRAMRAAAKAMGLRASVNRLVRGEPAHVVTLLA